MVLLLMQIQLPLFLLLSLNYGHSDTERPMTDSLVNYLAEDILNNHKKMGSPWTNRTYLLLNLDPEPLQALQLG